MDSNIVFFDGYCNLCNKTVDILIRFDKKKILRYAPLGGVTGSRLGMSVAPEIGDQGVVYYKRQGVVFEKSDAAIEIAVEVFPFGKVFWLMRLIPKFLRDFVYRLVAKKRYQLFGRRSSCRLPSLEEKELFLP